MTRFARTAWLSAGVSILALGLAAPALAQEADQDQTVQSGPIDEIVVTARRTQESIQDVPGAVSAFSGADLEELAAEDLTDIQNAVPNLNLAQGRGSNSSANIYIRGVGQPDALATFDPAVGVYIDDVYYSRIRGALVDVYDVERIEVLRGPQGTLYGKNTNGGALKIVTRKPSDEVRASASATYGSYDQLDLSARLSGPLSEGLAAGGLSLYRGVRDGYVEDPITGDEYNDKDTWAARGQLVFTPREDFELMLVGDYTEESPGLTVGQQQSTLTTIFGVPLLPPPGEDWDYETSTGLARDEFLDSTGLRDASPTPDTPTELENSQELEHYGVSAQASWDISDALTLKSITAYRELVYDDFIDIDATPLEIGDVFVGVDQDQTSQEFQLQYDNGGKLRGVAGLYWINENIDSTQFAYADDFLIGASAASFPEVFTREIGDNLNLHSYAAFANLTYDVTDRLSVTGGLRGTSETKHYDRFTTTNLAPVPVVVDQEETWDDISPLLSADFDIDDDTMIYARFSKGFKSGGFNGRANNSPAEGEPYDPEVVYSYEAGLKSDFADGRVRTNAAIFYNDYKDFQARVSDSITVDGIPTPVLSVLNAGELNIWGAELEATLAATDNLTFQGALGYLNAEYGEFIDQRFPGGDRAEFDEPPFSPEWTARLAGHYRIPTDYGEFNLGADVNYRGDTVLSVDQSVISGTTVTPVESAFQDGYWLLNARLAWTHPEGHWGVALYGKNLTDELYKSDYQEFSSVGNIRTAYFGDPRTVSVKLTYTY